MVEGTTRRRTVLALGGAVLVLAAGTSLLVGSNGLGPDEVWQLLWHDDGSFASDVVRGQRVPRTAVCLAVGAALGLAGAVMQALTRNPLADPGILGVNAGASLAVVVAVAVAGSTSVWFYLWFAFLGAAVASVTVYVLAGAGRAAAGPARLALAGVAVSAALASITQTVLLLDQEAFNEFRFWATGSVQGRGWAVLEAVGPFLLAGVVIALVVAPALGVLVLGEETAAGLGVRVARVRGGAILAVTLLCGAATAAVGPIAFVGLAVPMLARSLVGHDQRWVCSLSLVLGAAWLLVADVLGRVVVAEEVGAGIIAAVVGGPVLVAVARRRRVPAL